MIDEETLCIASKDSSKAVYRQNFCSKETSLRSAAQFFLNLEELELTEANAIALEDVLEDV